MDAHKAHLDAMGLANKEINVDKHAISDLKDIKESITNIYTLYGHILTEINKELQTDLAKQTKEQMRAIKEEELLLSVSLTEDKKVTKLTNQLEDWAKHLTKAIIDLKHQANNHYVLDHKYVKDLRIETK